MKKIQRKPGRKKRTEWKRYTIQLKEIDFTKVYKLASYQSTKGEIISLMKIPRTELYANKEVYEEFCEAYEAGRESGKNELRQTQFQLGKKNVVMSIFLGKQYLGQSDNPNSLQGADLGTVKVEFVNSKDENNEDRVKKMEEQLKEEIK